MALVDCIECGKKISDESEPPCIHCGFPEPFLTQEQKDYRDCNKRVEALEASYKERLDQLSQGRDSDDRAIKSHTKESFRWFLVMVVFGFFLMFSISNVEFLTLSTYTFPFIFFVFTAIGYFNFKSCRKKASQLIDEYESKGKEVYDIWREINDKTMEIYRNGEGGYN